MTVRVDAQAASEGIGPAGRDLLALVAERDAFAARLEAAETALREIAEVQPTTVAALRAAGVVFDGPLGNDPNNWEHVAFSIYTDLCEADTKARAALAAGRGEQG